MKSSGTAGTRGEDLPGLQLRNIDPDTYFPSVRRQTLIEMAGSDDSWVKRPENPDLCLVCDDMIAIVRELLDEVPTTIDTTAPVVLAEATPGPNEHGWNSEQVVVALIANDERNGTGVRDIVSNLSGAQTGGATTPGGSASETIVEEGATTVQYYATDRAGNIGEPQTMHVNIDRTPPAISSQTDPPANPEGWHRTDVVVSFDASDTLSGLAESPASGVIVTDEGAEFEVSAVAEDRAGNTATASVVVNLDKTVPDITIATPGNNATYLLHASASFSCSDVLSGVASCVGPVANGEPLDTSRVGEREFAVLARDVADNIRELTVRYAVRYGFAGFFPPLSSSGSVRVNSGRTIPVRWRLFDARQTPVRESAAITGVASYPVACESEVATGAAQPANGELHNVGKGLYSFNWRTESEWVGCRVLELSLRDGATHRALVEFRPRR